MRVSTGNYLVYTLLILDTDLKLYDREILYKIYNTFFGRTSNPPLAEMSIFFQLFYIFIYAKKHLNAVLHINIDSESLNTNAYQAVYMNYSIWLDVTIINEQAISSDKVNERFNRLQRSTLDHSNTKGDLNVVLDLVFMPNSLHSITH